MLFWCEWHDGLCLILGCEKMAVGEWTGGGELFDGSSLRFEWGRFEIRGSWDDFCDYGFNVIYRCWMGPQQCRLFAYPYCLSSNSGEICFGVLESWIFGEQIRDGPKVRKGNEVPYDFLERVMEKFFRFWKRGFHGFGGEGGFVDLQIVEIMRSITCLAGDRYFPGSPQKLQYWFSPCTRYLVGSWWDGWRARCFALVLGLRTLIIGLQGGCIWWWTCSIVSSFFPWFRNKSGDRVL